MENLKLMIKQITAIKNQIITKSKIGSETDETESLELIARELLIDAQQIFQNIQSCSKVGSMCLLNFFYIFYLALKHKNLFFKYLKKIFHKQ